MIRLAVVDVDGCLTPGEAGDWNWNALQAIRRINERSRDGKGPAVSLCTGRQEPYVEVLMQAIGAFMPGIYENGCGLYFPANYCFEEHPLITPIAREALAETKKELYTRIVSKGMGYFQPGKEASITLYPLDGTSVSQLFRAVEGEILDRRSLLMIHESVSCVDVTPAGIDKGVGVRWLLERVGLRWEEVGGIGDSPSDLSFLNQVGSSAAPANASPLVKAAVGYISEYKDGDGVVDILYHWIGN